MILDVRGEEAFAAGHLPGSGHVPLDELERRRAELPPRGVRLVVVAGSADEARTAWAKLESWGYPDVQVLAEPGDLATDRGPAARLWRPNPFLEEVLPLLPRGRAIDLACGAGRDAVFLALHGFDVTAVDLDEGALERARSLAANHGVTITTLRWDLEHDAGPLEPATWTLVTCFRFLQRQLLLSIARALAPGGHLVMETYRRGQERFGKPTRPRFLLEPGELSGAFAALKILRYEEPDPPGGPVTARLLARRPGEPAATTSDRELAP